MAHMLVAPGDVVPVGPPEAGRLAAALVEQLLGQAQVEASAPGGHHHPVVRVRALHPAPGVEAELGQLAGELQDGAVGNVDAQQLREERLRRLPGRLVAVGDGLEPGRDGHWGRGALCQQLAEREVLPDLPVPGGVLAGKDCVAAAGVLLAGANGLLALAVLGHDTLPSTARPRPRRSKAVRINRFRFCRASP